MFADELSGELPKVSGTSWTKAALTYPTPPAGAFPIYVTPSVPGPPRVCSPHCTFAAQSAGYLLLAGLLGLLAGDPYRAMWRSSQCSALAR